MKKQPDKNIRLEGMFCTLSPVTEKELPQIVELRNREKNKYFMNQKFDITLKMQEEWFQEYQMRENDIYLGIWDKAGQFIGTIRLYHIKEEECEEGSCIIDEQYAREAPYAVEAKYLLTKYAFDGLGVHRMINQIREDNQVMNSLAKQQGYCLERKVDINGAVYNYMILEADKFCEDKLQNVLNYWKGRNEG